MPNVPPIVRNVDPEHQTQLDLWCGSEGSHRSPSPVAVCGDGAAGGSAGCWGEGLGAPVGDEENEELVGGRWDCNDRFVRFVDPAAAALG